jgi:hypothetical protein
MPNDRITYPEHSCFHDLKIKYKGFNRDNTDSYTTTTIIYQGTRELCEEGFAEIQTSGHHDQYGNIESVRLFQDEGPIWNLEVKYSISKHGVGISSSTGSSYGPKSSELTCRMMALPIESRDNYLKNWNYDLYSTNPKADRKPDFYYVADAKNDGIQGTAYEYKADPLNPQEDLTTKNYYYWAKSANDCPTLPNNQIWYKRTDRDKPGVESFDYPVYEITESSKHTTMKQASWAVSNRAGCIAKPLNGDFDIVKKYGGNWLCEGGNVSYDGSYWIATCSYSHSPSKEGWDPDLYEKPIK